MAAEQRPKVGVVGLGAMGMGIARTLAAVNFPVTGFDLREERRALAAGTGVTATNSVGDCFGGSSYVVFSLPTANDVAAVVEANLKFLGNDGQSRVILVDTSTSEPDISRSLAARLDALGHGFIDAPVSGGPAGASKGALTMMIGGSERDVALARPIIEAISAKALHVGPAGAGNVAKLVNNMLAAAHMVSTSEALKVAVAAGVSAEAALNVINAASGRSMISEMHFPTWVMSERFDSGFTMALMRKDVRLAHDLAGAYTTTTPLSDLVARLWLKDSTTLSDDDDFTRMGDFRVSPSGA